MTLEEPEKTLTALEADARGRVQKTRNASITVDENKPDQPEVNQLKKRSKNRLLTLGILILTAFIILAVMGDYALSHFKQSSPTQEKQTRETTSSAIPVSKRKGMGQSEKPFESQQETQISNQILENKPVIQPVSLNKSLALVIQEQSTSKSATVTREVERDETIDDTEKQVAAVDTKTAAVEGVATITTVSRIPLDPDLYIPVDTYIPCTLQTRFVSDVAGRISCVISDDVYSQSTYVRLIPAGTRARGVYKTGTLKHGQGRMFVIWTELRTPEGLKIPMVDSQVVGQLGESGIDGWIDTHFWTRFGNAMMLGMIPDITAAATEQAGNKDRNTDYTENSRQALADIAKTAFDNSVNIPPTLYKNQGDIVGIMTGSDIDFSPIYRLKMK